uniref:Zinc knuckle CX2CX4HX4C n=1 Tax=Tanacetum cinerariifolium TaxID=118510 RepID=A0A6L2N3F2_TANCI|nr:zinc knuckle CX2CX4HX4C [Tanacetum cinerariifolium]
MMNEQNTFVAYKSGPPNARTHSHSIFIRNQFAKKLCPATTHEVKCKYVKRNTEKGRKNEENADSYEGTMAGVDINTLTMEQYLALSKENQARGVVKPKIGGNVNFETKSQFMCHKTRYSYVYFRLLLRGPLKDGWTYLLQELSTLEDLLKKALSKGMIPGMTPTQKWHDRTLSRSLSSSSNTDGLAAIVSKLDNLGRDMKKLKENVHAIQVGCIICEGPHLDKECSLNEEVKLVKEDKYEEFGRPTPFNGRNGAKYRVGPPGYYTHTDNRPPYREKRPSLEELMNKHLKESARRSTKMNEWITKI